MSHILSYFICVLFVTLMLTLLPWGCRREGGGSDADVEQALVPGSTLTTAPASMPATGWHRPRYAQRRSDRDRMVDRQIAHPSDDRTPVRDERTIEAMRQVPRHLFVPAAEQDRAYGDSALPIGHSQTISQPYIVALMTEALQLPPNAKVLEVGTGSGYQAAVLAELTPHVYSIEIVEPLAKESAERLRRLGYSTVRVKAGDGYFGWPEAAPFDGIIVPCAADKVPQQLWDQLKPGGRIVIPLGGSSWVQYLTVITKTSDGQRKTETLIPCAFVPMTGEVSGKKP